MNTRRYIKLDMAQLRLLAKSEPRDFIEQYADDKLTAYAKLAMQEKLDAARSKGRGGWWNKDECSIAQLREMLQEHVEKGDMVDVMNFAAMIFTRECADA